MSSPNRPGGVSGPRGGGDLIARASRSAGGAVRTAGPAASHGRPGPRHGAGRRHLDGLDGQHDLGILRGCVPGGPAGGTGPRRPPRQGLRGSHAVPQLGVGPGGADRRGDRRRHRSVVVAGANNGSGPAPSSLDAGYRPPARPRGLHLHPRAAGRRIPATLGQVATSGGTIVAMAGSPVPGSPGRGSTSLPTTARPGSSARCKVTRRPARPRRWSPGAGAAGSRSVRRPSGPARTPGTGPVTLSFPSWRATRSPR